MFASYMALSLTKKIMRSSGRSRIGWIAAGSIVMGCGIWSMHFIGMMAFHLPVSVGYDVPVTVLSLFLAVFASFVAFTATAPAAVSRRRLAVGGFAMGAGITGMHYTGMAAMRMDGSISYDPVVWTLSAVIALIVSYVALFLFMRFRTMNGASGWRWACAVLMGVAVCGMHYTGMAAARFAVPHGAGHGGGAANVTFLLFGIALAMSVILLVSWAAVYFDRHVLERMAYSDPLTGLANRHVLDRAFEERLSPDAGGSLAVLFLDLDRFKTINDTLGHDTGDELILQVSRRLQSGLAADQTVYRLGGDEFLLLLPGCGRDEAAALAERLLQELKAPYRIDDNMLYVTASIGISLAPEHAKDRSALMKAADTAMYEAKHQGKNRYVVFDVELGSRMERNMRLEKDLRKAMALEEFYVVYQPQWDSSKRRPIGMEALVRWKHPELGVVSPVEFIPLAEETGLIIPLTQWVLREACREAEGWRRDGWREASVSVNLSVRVFESRQVIEMVEGALRDAGFAPERLELEITESLLLYDVREIVSQLEELRRIGVKIAMDDFGSGYSSLGSLDRLPIDTLKIDRLFIEDSDMSSKQAILQAIITMASQLRIEMVAEGVETEEQMRLLSESGCHVMQGYYYGKPMEQEALRAWLAARLDAIG
jgi:diguanylate cyclase (GGDEF)-like protein